MKSKEIVDDVTMKRAITVLLMRLSNATNNWTMWFWQESKRECFFFSPSYSRKITSTRRTRTTYWRIRYQTFPR
ncbi:Uncharacterised protein [Streptococcus dysgalactiae]|nr:Uncharacterised protein [Streptococcus dysgalactiae]